MAGIAHSHIDKDEVKLAATGQWQSILTSVGGLPQEYLTTKERDCPRCGGNTRFRVWNMDEGALRCSHCFPTDNGDGLAAIGWLLGVDFAEALRLVADHLGMAPASTDSTKVPKPIDVLQMLASVKGCTREGLVEYGAEVEGEKVVFPVYGPDKQQCSSFTIWPKAAKDDKRLKGMLAKGKPSGLFFPLTDGGATHFPVKGETWCIVEGVKDCSALQGLDYLAAGMNGDALPQKFVSMFQGVDVVIVPDRTTAAEEKAQESAARLTGVANSVRIAALPLPLDGTRGDDTRDALKQANGEKLVRQCIDHAKPRKSGSGKEIELTTFRKVTADRLATHRQGPVPRIPTGIPKLDETLGGGFDLGTMVIVAALSSHGKSAFALQTGHFVTTQMGIPALFVSIEMSLPQLADRTFSHISDAPKANWHQLIERLEADSEKHFDGAEEFYLVGSICDLEDVESAVRQAFEKGAKIAFIDYAQKITTGNKDDMNAAMQKVSSRMSALAGEYQAVVVLLAQLNKRVAKRDDFTPQQDDVYYGTSLVNDADYWLSNIWPYKLDKKNPLEDYLILVGKNRNGDPGVGVKCKFNAPRQKITEKFPTYQPQEKPSERQAELDSFDAWNQQGEGSFYMEGQ